MSKRKRARTAETLQEDDRLQMALLAAEVCASATEAALEATQKLWAAELKIRRLLTTQADELPSLSETLTDLQEFSLQSALSWQAALSAGTVAVGQLASEDKAPD